MTKWFAADFHYFHDKIISKEFDYPRPFDSIEEHNETLINNWNKEVRADDTGYLAGDIIMNTNEQNLDERVRSTLGRMNGKITIIVGNHDSDTKIRAYYPYVKKIVGYVELKDMIITHIPVHESQLDRFGFCCHGHVHSKSLSDPRYFNISMEAINYKPIAYDEIKRQLRGRN